MNMFTTLLAFMMAITAVMGQANDFEKVPANIASRMMSSLQVLTESTTPNASEASSEGNSSSMPVSSTMANPRVVSPIISRLSRKRRSVDDALASTESSIIKALDLSAEQIGQHSYESASTESMTESSTEGIIKRRRRAIESMSSSTDSSNDASTSESWAMNAIEDQNGTSTTVDVQPVALESEGTSTGSPQGMMAGRPSTSELVRRKRQQQQYGFIDCFWSCCVCPW